MRDRAVRKAYTDLKVKMERLLQMADRADLAVEMRPTKFWTEVLEPMLLHRVEGFQQAVLTMDPESFEKQREVALFAQTIVDLVESLSTGGSGLRKQAERILRQLEAAEAQGLVPKPEPRVEPMDGPG